MTAPSPRPAGSEWMNYDSLLHNRCGRTLADHPLPHAPAVDCPFPERPPVEFIAAPDTTGGELREQIVEAMSWSENFDSGRLGHDGADRLLRQYEVVLLAERDALAAKVQAVEALADTLARSMPGDVERHYMADRIRRALGTPTTAGGQ